MKANNLKCYIRFLLTTTLAVTKDSPSHRVVAEFDNEKKFFLMDFLTCIGIMTLRAGVMSFQLKKIKGSVCYTAHVRGIIAAMHDLAKG